MNYVIDAERIRRLAKAPSGLPEKQAKWRLVTVGRYCEQKGQHLIPAIARELKKVGLSFEWHVIAPGCGWQMGHIERSLLDNGVEDKVFYHEVVSNPFAAMATADVYVQPSLFEGFGLTVSEALIAGRYVVATDIPEFREQITCSGIGLLSRLTPESFSDNILIALQMIEKGEVWHDYETPYTAHRTYGQFCDILERSAPVP